MKEEFLFRRLISARDQMLKINLFSQILAEESDIASAWEAICSEINLAESLLEFEGNAYSNAPKDVATYRQELVKAIAPVVLANLYDSAAYSEKEVAVYTQTRTEKIVNSLMDEASE